MTGKTDLSVVIVNWNVKDLLKKCLASVYRQTLGISFEVFVVDNASPDNSAAMVAAEFPQVKLIANLDNKGFAAANNQGIREAKGEFILLLNPDTEILDNALAKAVELTRQNVRIGVLGCRLLNSDQTLQPSARRFPTLADQFLILLKVHHLWPDMEIFRRYFAQDFDYSAAGEADQVMGAFFLIRRETLDQIGLLDEGYFIWFEEVDFCRRAKDAGWKIAYAPEVEIIHHCSQSFKQVLSLSKQKIFNRSLLRYFQKHRPLWEYLLLAALNPLSLLLAYIFQSAKKAKGVAIKR